MISVGKYLKDLRETKNLSLEQAALVTKIGKSTLIAIEDAKVDELPAKCYLRGFVFSYGKFLGADTNKLSELFAQELGTTNPEVSQEDIEKETWKTVPLLDKLQLNSRTYIIVGLVAVTAVAIITRNIYQKYKDETVITQEVTKDQLPASEAKLPALTTPPADKTETSANEIIKEPTPLAITPGEDKEAAKKDNNEATVVGEKTFAASKKFPKELLIEAQEDTAIKIRIGQDEEKMIKLLKGDFHTVKARSQVQVETVNLKDIKVIYNGTLRTARKNEIKSNILSF